MTFLFFALVVRIRLLSEGIERGIADPSPSAFKGVAGRALGKTSSYPRCCRRWGLVGADQLGSEFCILYGSSPSSAQSHPICRQPIVLRETVSPHLRLRTPGFFFFSSPRPRPAHTACRCKQGAAATLSRRLPPSLESPAGEALGEGLE